MEEQIDFKEFEKTLITLSGRIDTIEQLEQHKGEKFNIFSILNMERKEVETHSMFLYELLNPNGSHFQGTKYLDIFIKKVLGINNFEYKNIKVGRETFTDTSRRIDFTIENDDNYIAIEMKIDAGDQNEQLDDYFTFSTKQNKPNTKVYYLTLDGKDASEKSAKNENTKYKLISFKKHILEFIEESIEKSASLPVVRETLVQYRNLIKKITNQTTQEITVSVRNIITTPEIAKAATLMAQNLDKVWALREVMFWKSLATRIEEYLKNKKLNTKGWELYYPKEFLNDNEDLIESEGIIKNIFNNKKNTSTSYREIGIQKKLTKDGYFNFSIIAYPNENLNFQIQKEDGDIESIATICNISEKTGILSEYKNTTRWKRSKYLINFSKDYLEPTYDIFDDTKLEELVSNVAQEVESYMDKIVEVIK